MKEEREKHRRKLLLDSKLMVYVPDGTVAEPGTAE